MANIVNILYRDIFLKYKLNITIGIVLLIFIIAGSYGYYKYMGNNLKPDPSTDVANANRRNQPVDIMYFYTTWCPHCKKSMPEWTSFSNDYNQKPINGFIVNCVAVNCDDTNDPDVSAQVQKYGVEHFPTVKIVLDNAVVDFDARVTKSNLVAFVNTATK